MPDITKDPNSPFSQGWDIVKACNEALKNKNYTEVRQQMAAYFQLGIAKAGKLHSAILSIAVKLGTQSADFHLVPFLNIWDLANLRPEDSDAITSQDGKRIPSLVERLAKSYAYALLFHPEEHIEPELENVFFPHLQKKGFLGVPGPKIVPLLATRTFQKEVTSTYGRSRTMTFVSLISSNGTEFLTEVHTLTAFQYMRYEDIPGTVFDTLMRTSQEKGNIRIEAAIPKTCTEHGRSSSNPEESFPTKVGFVEFIDLAHGHTHIYDNESRHMVAEHSPYTTIGKLNASVKTGDFVAFTPIIPLTSNFKTAIIRRVLSAEEGPDAFGLRKAKVEYVDPQKGYASWELLPQADNTVAGGNTTSQIRPIIETGTTEPSFTKGYINQSLATALNKPLPAAGTEIEIIVYLKRGKDRQKRPHVIYFQ